MRVGPGWSPKSSTPTGARSGSRAPPRTQAATTIFSWARFRVPAAAQRSQIRTSRCAKPAPQRGRCCSPPRPSAGMSPDSITIARGAVIHLPSNRRTNFGQLAASAAKLPVPKEVQLKDPKDFALIGRRVTRTDSRAKSNGTAVYTQDVKLPGMLTALIAHPPRFGGKPKSFDAAKAKAVKGVVDVVAIPQGVAVLATDFWSAKKGRDALTVEWEESGAFKLGSAEIMAEYKNLAATPGLPARKEGDLPGAFARAAKTLEAAYEFPYLAHA